MSHSDTWAENVDKVPGHPHDDRPELQRLREKVREVCRDFPNSYWRECDIERRYPQEFVDRMTEERLLAALIPEEYGGLGLGISEASIIMEEVNRSGGHAAACHAQLLLHTTAHATIVKKAGVAAGGAFVAQLSIVGREARG